MAIKMMLAAARVKSSRLQRLASVFRALRRTFSVASVVGGS